jgi:hypothetical protein
MVGYLIALLWQGKTPGSGDLVIKETIFKKSFIVGVGIGLVLAVCYILF